VAFGALEASAIVRVVGSSLERFEKDGYEVKHDGFFGGKTARAIHVYVCIYTDIVCFVFDNHIM